MSKEVTFALSTLNADYKDDTILFVRDGLLSILAWKDIKVTRLKRMQITFIEKFIIEAALTLRTFTAQDIEEIVSIPHNAFGLISRRLISTNILTKSESGYYSVLEDNARTALKEEALLQERDGVLSFFYLPRTDELIAFDDESSSTKLPRLSRLHPVCCAPLSLMESSKTVYSLLVEHFQARTIINIPEDVVDIKIQESERNIPNIAPAYRYSGYIKRYEGKELVEVTLFDEKERNEKGMFVAINLAGANKLVEKWKETANLLEEDLYARKAGESFGLREGSRISMSHVGGMKWSYTIDKEGASFIRKDRLLVDNIILDIINEEHILTVLIELIPDDEESEYFFTIDHIISRILSYKDKLTNKAFETIIAYAIIDYNQTVNAKKFSVDAIKDRLWDLKLFEKIYLLREEEDFNYD